MNRDRLHEAFRRGQIASQQRSSFDFTLALDKLKRTPDGWFLAVDLAELAERGVEAAPRGSEATRNFVVVARPDGDSGLLFRLMDVFLTDEPERPAEIEPPSADADDIVLESTNNVLEQQHSNLPLAPAARALATDDARSQATVQVQPPATPPLELTARALDAVKEAEDLLLVQSILKVIKANKLNFLDEVEAMIVAKAHDRRCVRDNLINVMPTWPVTHTCIEDIDWTGLEGLSKPLPMRNRLLLEGVITGVLVEEHAGAVRAGEVRIARPRVITQEHKEAVDSCTLKTSHCVKLAFEAEDRGLRLSLFQALGRRVILAAQVSRCLAVGSPWHLSVIDTFPVNVTEFDLQRYRRRLETELKRKPPEDGFWQLPSSEDAP
jgi:hypothetical protein